MVAVRERIVEYLKAHPDGASDAEIRQALGLRYTPQVNACCRQLEVAGFVERRKTWGPIRNVYVGSGEGAAPVSTAVPAARVTNSQPHDLRPWSWEGNVQDAIVRHLVGQGYAIRRVSNTETREHGRDIEADKGSAPLWVTVKGWPQSTERTQPSTQAGHWFKDAIFDVIAWRGESAAAHLAMALPDFPRYRALAARVRWLQTAGGYAHYWVREDGTVEEDR